jgi:hypothetical protein
MDGVIDTAFGKAVASTLSDRANDLARVAGGKYIGGDVFRYHTAGTDNAAVTDSYARTNNGAAADPDILANGNRLCKLKSGCPFQVVHGMHSGI